MKPANRNKKGQMQVFLILFSLIMAIGIVISIYNILAFEARAKNMMDAAIDAQYFRKDYMLAMQMPVQNITVCHKTLLDDDCTVYIRAYTEAEAEWFYYPQVSVEIQDPKANISTRLGVEVLNTIMVGAILPEMKETSVVLGINAFRPEDCWVQGRYKYCRYACTIPIQITKKREYNSTFDMYVDRMNISQSLGDECLA